MLVLSASLLRRRKLYNQGSSFIQKNDGNTWVRSPWASSLPLNNVSFSSSNGALVKVSASSAKLCWEYFQSWSPTSSSNFLDLSIYVSPSVISHLTLHLEAIYAGENHLALGLSSAHVGTFSTMPLIHLNNLFSLCLLVLALDSQTQEEEWELLTWS